MEFHTPIHTASNVRPVAHIFQHKQSIISVFHTHNAIYTASNASNFPTHTHTHTSINYV